MDKENLCALYENCTQLPVWDKLKVSMVKILEDTTLEDMVRDIENIEVKTTLNN